MKADATLDATGKLCPIPIIWTAERIKDLEVGQVLEVLATDEAKRRAFAVGALARARALSWTSSARAVLDALREAGA